MREAKPMRQESNINLLDGVHFSLSPRLSMDTHLQYMATAVDSVMARLTSIEWGALEYNFNLEKSVLDVDSHDMNSGEDMEELAINMS